tara:strand:- start:1570 stop:2208 length:639 start_codon:yes stop_codon:yes gene_type:complete
MYYNRIAPGKSLQAHLNMAFLTEKAQSAVATTESGGYLNPSKLESGGSARFALLDDQPLEYWEVWGESGDGKLKPFRFADNPSSDDVEIEMGNEFTRRLNRDGTAPEASKFAIAVPVFNHESQKVEIFSATQKGIIKEFDKISQMEDYADLLAWDFVLSREGTGLKTEYSLRAVPRKKGTSPLIEATYQEQKDNGFNIKRLMTGGNPFKEEE